VGGRRLRWIMGRSRVTCSRMLLCLVAMRSRLALSPLGAATFAVMPSFLAADVPPPRAPLRAVRRPDAALPFLRANKPPRLLAAAFLVGDFLVGAFLVGAFRVGAFATPAGGAVGDGTAALGTGTGAGEAAARPAAGGRIGEPRAIPGAGMPPAIMPKPTGGVNPRRSASDLPPGLPRPRIGEPRPRPADPGRIGRVGGAPPRLGDWSRPTNSTLSNAPGGGAPYEIGRLGRGVGQREIGRDFH
jgi:hypothetical protein